MSRDPKLLLPAVYKLFEQWTGGMAQLGLTYMITRTGCNLSEQMAIYTKGRMSLEDVNRYFVATGMNPILKVENVIVTKTLNSEHIIKDGYCNAWDFVLMKDGSPTWQGKTDINKNNIPDYVEAGKMAESIGLVSGASYGDYCHVNGVK